MEFLQSRVNHRGKLKIDPRTKFVILVMTNIVMLSGPTKIIEFFITSLITMLFLNDGKKKLIVKYLIVYGVLVLGDIVCSLYLTGTISILVLTLTRITRLYMPMVMAFMYMMTTSTVSEFVAAFRKMKVPDVIIIPFSVMFRFFPTLNETMKQIISAMRFRGIKINAWTILAKPLTTMEYILVPLLMSTSKIANDLTAASLSRGLTVSGKRTTLKQIKLGWSDYLIVLSCLVLLVMGVMS